MDDRADVTWQVSESRAPYVGKWRGSKYVFGRRNWVGVEVSGRLEMHLGTFVVKVVERVGNPRQKAA